MPMSTVCLSGSAAASPLGEDAGVRTKWRGWKGENILDVQVRQQVLSIPHVPRVSLHVSINARALLVYRGSGVCWTSGKVMVPRLRMWDVCG